MRRSKLGKLDGKITIVTGATSGIGKRTAEIFAEEGARVVLAGRRADIGQSVADAIGKQARFVKTDVTDEDAFRALIQQTVDWHGRLDCLFNNAGGPAPRGGVEGMDIDAVNAAFVSLFTSVLIGMKHAAPIMKKQGSGSIINNGSVAAYQGGLSSSTVYSAAKAATLHFTRCVALELGEVGIRVNSISPGAIVTGIFAKAAGLDDTEADQKSDMMEQIFETAQPIPRAGQPDDIARAAVFLASDDSTFINGADLVIDGGKICGQPWSPQQEGIKQLAKAFGAS